MKSMSLVLLVLSVFGFIPLISQVPDNSLKNDKKGNSKLNNPSGISDKKKFKKSKDELVLGISRVWAVDDGEKIKLDDITNHLANSPQNPIWDGTTINISGAKNEVIAFQLIIQADNSGAKNINVELDGLTNGSYTISNSQSEKDDPFDYTGKCIELFTEHYMNLTKRTEPLWFYHPNAKPSDYYLGWVPDALIPFEAPSGKGGAPFDIIANMNQGIWIDIWIPRDAVAGLYKGTIHLTADNRDFKNIPIELKVNNFSLPDEFHAHNMFYIEPKRIARAHGINKQSDEYFAMETKYRQMAHRHRIDIVSNVPSLDQMDIYDKKYLTGEMYTPENNYEGPGEGIGNNTFSIGVYGSLPSEYYWSQEGWWQGSDAWEEWFIKNAPLVKRHKYLYPDEPDYRGPEGAKGIASMDTIRMQAKWSHSNPGIGKNIPTFVTNKVKPELAGYVDFWAISSREFTTNITPEIIANERESGHKFGIYNGYRPGMGAVVIDADAVEFRVMPWIMWKYDIDQYFYWETTLWNGEMFNNSETIDKSLGDGSMFYPGQNIKYPDQDRGLAGPFSSIRMKNWRRGAQDYEYLWLMKEAGLDSLAKAISDSCIPRALWEADISKNIPWSNHGYYFENFRKQMASLLDSLATNK